MKPGVGLKLIIMSFILLIGFFSFAQSEECRPTAPDMLGPFYKPDAPARSVVGKGYILSGVVRSSKDCSPISEARIEFWLTSPKGEYDDDHRATVHSDARGSYRFESNYPRPYGGRPPHIHIRVTAKGFRTLVTQHYPEEGSSSGIFDLVLIPGK
jgi:protocatechuate 3,4-dioxygenase beta subunit